MDAVAAPPEQPTEPPAALSDAGPDRPGSRLQVVLADGRSAGRRASEPTRAALQRIGVGTALLLVVLLLATWVLTQRAAEQEGVADARMLTQVLADTVVEPALEDAVLRSDPAVLARLDALVEERLIGSAGVMRVKLWTTSGEILYSDEPRLMGSTFQVTDQQRTVLSGGGSQGAVSRLVRDENVFDALVGEPRLLEVYTAVHTPAGEPLLLELYFPYERVVARQGEIIATFTPIAFVVLLLFASCQGLLSWVNLRWLRQQREQILRDRARIADVERRKLAVDLHDGVVQDLVGASLVVSTAAGAVRSAGSPQIAAQLDGAATAVRAGVRGLRSTLDDLFPTDLRSAGLHAALDSLLAPARSAGTAVTLVVPDGLDVSLADPSVLYRVAQEACRNAVQHARASSVEVRVTVLERAVHVTVVDDGVGYDPTSVPQAGHLGLQGMADLVERAGGRLVVTTTPGRGTAVDLELPR